MNPIVQQASESIIHYMNKWLTVDKRVRIKLSYIFVYVITALTKP